MANRWRMSKKEVEDKLDTYLEKIVPTMDFDTHLWDNSKRTNYEESVRTFYKDNVDRRAKFKAAGCIMKKNVDEWAEFSLAVDRDPEEILLRILLDHYYCEDPGATVCISYLGNNILLDEQFVKEVIYITSGFFDFDDWDDEHVDVVNRAALATTDDETVKILKKVYTDGQIKKVFTKTKYRDISITFPVDSSAIKYSPEFKKLYNDYIKFVPTPTFSNNTDN